jgi:hypothetical protein
LLFLFHTSAYDARPSTIPRKKAACALINPEAGVTPANPAIAPVIAAVIFGFSILLLHDNII